MIEGTQPVPLSAAIRAQLRRWRGTAVTVAVVLAAGTVVALLQARPQTAPLDPANVQPGGAHAVAALLAGRGQRVMRTLTAAGAVAAARAPGAVLVVTSPANLHSGALATLARSRADLLLVAPDRAALAALAPQVRLAGPAPVESLPARCALTAARLAGPAWLGGVALRAAGPAWRCYPVRPGGPATLVRYASDGRIITVLGAGAAFANQNLGQDGNAALALDLLAGARTVVWLAPSPAPPAAAAARGGASLIPDAAWLVVLQLAVAVALTAGWRMRRFGPLVPERLPTVVRASETVRGHGRLYRARRARGRAAAVLRAATLARIAAATGIPAGLPPETVSQELAGRAGRQPGQIAAVLFGPAPADDAALVALAADLDTLEGQVLAN